MSTVKVNGTELEYREQGKGQSVVLVHGSVSDFRSMQTQQDVFSQRYRTIAYSRRYHWPNDPIGQNADYSMQEQLEDLEGVLTRLDAAPAHLVGHSYGAVLCLLLAMQKPELVRSLVLAEAPVYRLFISNTPKPLEILKLLVTRPRTAVAVVKFGATGLGPATALAEKGDMAAATQTFGTAVLGSEFYGRLSAERREQVQANTIRSEFTGSGMVALNEQEIHTVSQPTLLINGDRSPALFHRLTDRLEELLPNSERIQIRNASHIMHEDNAPAYNKAVLSFLSKHH